MLNFITYSGTHWSDQLSSEAGELRVEFTATAELLQNLSDFTNADPTNSYGSYRVLQDATPAVYIYRGLTSHWEYDVYAVQSILNLSILLV